MSIPLIARVLIESQVGFSGLGIEFVFINDTANNATYIAFAKARSLPTDEAWLIYRVKQMDTTLFDGTKVSSEYTRLACTPGQNDCEKFNKILINYLDFDYVES